jgi:2-oxoglutarate dehydrogenase E2 component (dihydrolipoamide succinyltransferase)
MIDVQMPQLGESVAEGTVTQWHVKVGDFVRVEQPLLEVATDKADSDVPSPTTGVVKEILAKEGDVVPAGGLLCKIDDSVSEGTQVEAGGAPPRGDGDGRKPQAQESEDTEARLTQPAAAPPGRTLTSPSARRLARSEGVDIGVVRGSGERGRVTHDDVRRAARSLPNDAAPPSMPGAPPSRVTIETPAAPPPAVRGVAPELTQLMNELPVPGVGFRSYKVPAYQAKPGDEVIPFSRRRRITADHMVYSQQVSPHVVTVAEIDLHATSALRDQHKDAFGRDGVPLTFLAFVVAAVVKALREYPTLNARVLDDSYVKIRDINVGVAVDTPSGLLVASIKNADQLSMRGIAGAIDDVASRAKNGKITADDLMGTTFTVSNPGRKGNLFGGAIISQPNVAILRVGEIKKRPVVVTRDGDDSIAIHPVMFAALSYDHRIVDGVEANAFLWRIAEVLTKAEFEL